MKIYVRLCVRGEFFFSIPSWPDESLLMKVFIRHEECSIGGNSKLIKSQPFKCIRNCCENKYIRSRGKVSFVGSKMFRFSKTLSRLPKVFSLYFFVTSCRFVWTTEEEKSLPKIYKSRTVYSINLITVVSEVGVRIAWEDESSQENFFTRTKSNVDQNLHTTMALGGENK